MELDRYAHKLIRTFRVKIADEPGNFARLAREIAEVGGSLGDIMKMSLDSHSITRDVTVYLDDENAQRRLVRRIHELEGFHLVGVRDEVIEVHKGGKIGMKSRVDVRGFSDLRKIYTPGVAMVSRLIRANPERASDLTSISNTIAIVTNGTAVLGLGDVGVVPAMPVMEGKAVIANAMADISAIPILIDIKSPKKLVETVASIAPTFGAILLEDIAAPDCFGIEAELDRRLDIPVFHDDQHGTAIVVLAALTKALDRTGRKMKRARAVISGAGAAGIAIARILAAAAAGDILLCDRRGAIYSGRREHMNPVKRQIARITNRERRRGKLAEVLKGADVFIGVSAPKLLTKEMVRSMAPGPIVLALANPEPEIMPSEALAAGAAVAADGRAINNAMAFPGIFRGALDARAKCINDEMKLAAARVITEITAHGELQPEFLKRSNHAKVAAAVRRAAIASGAAPSRSR